MKVGIIGFGRMGEHIAGALQNHPRVNHVVLCDTDVRKAPGVQDEKVTFTTDLDLLLNDSRLSLVFIAAPNHCHRDLALACLRAGKAVMLEKPIGETLESSREVVEESERLGGFLQIGFELRYSWLYLQAHTWIREGLIGSITNIQCRYICSEFHGPDSWRNDPRTGGSLFAEKLCHYVDLQRWWSGDEIRMVSCFCAPNVVPYYLVHDNYHAVYRFSKGAIGSIQFVMYMAESFGGDPLQNAVSQQADDGHELRYLILGTDGAIETDVFRRRIRRWEFRVGDGGFKSRLEECLSWEEKDDHACFHNTTSQTHDIVNRVFQGQPPKIHPRDALATMIAVDATDRAADSGESICLNENGR